MKRGHRGVSPIRLGLALALATGLALTPVAEAAHGGAPSVAFTEPDYLKWLIDSRQPVVVIDLRPAAEYATGHPPGARSVPMAELDRRFREIPTTPMVVLYCRCSLEEAATAYAFLETRGYLNHVVLQEGHEGWARRRFPLVK